MGDFIFNDAVVTTLSSWYSRGAIDMANRRNPLNNDEVIVLFEDIEQDEVTSKTLDEYEVRNQATNHMFHALCK